MAWMPQGVHGVTASGKPLHVLVVDDDADVRTAIVTHLLAAGFDAVEAVDGVDALERVTRAVVFHAVVCDLQMPRLGGTGLLRLLRHRGLNPVMVILSAHFDLLAHTSGLGQVYALAKPFDPDRLVSMLREALEERS
jgi:CheY-like chemotaxis protein